MTEASYYKQLDDQTVLCRLCPHNCHIASGKAGVCRARRNQRGKLLADNYGKVTSLALDPIEKKPLARFHPGKMILSVGSYGCNFHCGFCQNHTISMGDPAFRIVSPEKIADQAKALAADDNIGVAFTYNEPLIGIEFLRDCGILIHEQGQKNVVVTNGFINEEPLVELLPLIDAMNIDLKSFELDFYQKVGGKLEDIKQTIYLAAQSCHIEVTSLMIPGENDGRDVMEEQAEWLASIDKQIPLHVSRFFPSYQYNDHKNTPVATVHQLAEAAKAHLKYVYTGNC